MYFAINYCFLLWPAYKFKLIIGRYVCMYRRKHVLGGNMYVSDSIGSTVADPLEILCQEAESAVQRNLLEVNYSPV